MGEAVPGSRLDRLAQAAAIVRQLCERGMSHRQIAREVGVSPALVGKWAKGMLAPSSDQLAALRELISVIRGDEIELSDRQGVAEVGYHRS